MWDLTELFLVCKCWSPVDESHVRYLDVMQQGRQYLKRMLDAMQCFLR
jgi:hypothetical protein